MAEPQGAQVQEPHAATAESAPEVARRYAEALIRAAEHEGAVDLVLGELAELERDVLKANPRFAQILASPRVSAAQKDRILVELLENRARACCCGFCEFCSIATTAWPIWEARSLKRLARCIWDKRHARVPVQVRSAHPLDERQTQALLAQLTRLTGATPILQVSIDPTWSAGLVVLVGDLRYDASVKSLGSPSFVNA